MKSVISQQKMTEMQCQVDTAVKPKIKYDIVLTLQC